MKSKSHDHTANQKGWQEHIPTPSKSTVKQIGITPPSHKGRNTKPTNPGSKAPRQAEEAMNPGTDVSNGGAA